VTVGYLRRDRAGQDGDDPKRDPHRQSSSRFSRPGITVVNAASVAAERGIEVVGVTQHADQELRQPHLRAGCTAARVNAGSKGGVRAHATPRLVLIDGACHVEANLEGTMIVTCNNRPAWCYSARSAQVLGKHQINIADSSHWARMVTWRWGIVDR
jgi:hypothetical protein